MKACPHDLFGAKQIATYLRVSRSTLWRLMRQTAIPIVRVGGLRASRQQLDQWTEGRKISTDCT